MEEYSEAQQPPAMNFNQLPGEIKTKIFSYFTTKEISKRLPLVCKEWWALSKDPWLWKRLELTIRPEIPAEVYRQVIAHCKTSLTSLRIYTPTLKNELMTYYPDFNLQNLKELDLRGWWYINNFEMCNIVSNFPNVEILNLRVRAHASDLAQISKLKDLKSFTISGHLFQKLHRPDLELIVKKCTKLEALMLRVRDCFDDQFLVQLAEYRKETLKHLALSGDNLTAKGVRAITACKNLSTLCMKSTYFSVSTEMFEILSAMQKLEWLNLGGSIGLKNQTWTNLFMCPNLSSLKILEVSHANIDDRALVNFAFTCKQLAILDVSLNFFIHDEGVKAVIDNCSQLWYLDISGTEITRDTLRYIPTKLPLLKYLKIRRCSRIAETHIQIFTETCPRVEVWNGLLHNNLEYTVDERLNLKWQVTAYMEP